MIAPHNEQRTSAVATICWFVAWALAWGCVDVVQVKAIAQTESTVRLAAMVLSLYAVLGIAAGAILPAVVRRLTPPSWHRPESMLGLAFSVWGLFVVVAYINIVHLPSIAEPITLASNLALALAGLLVWWASGKLRWLGRPATSVLAPLLMSGLCVAAGVAVAASRTDTTLAAQGQAPAEAPHVVVVAIDSLRLDHTGLAGDGQSSTPRLDGLARQGVAFTRAYAQASWTKPSVASLFTSVYPSTHDANLRRDRLSSELVTMPEFFAQAGYRTAIFSANPWVSPAFGFEQGVEHFYETDRETFVRLVLLLRILKLPDRLVSSNPISAVLRNLQRLYGFGATKLSNCERDVAILDAFEDWMESHRRDATFSYLHLMSPHIPYDPPQGPNQFANAEQVKLLLSDDPLPPARRELLLRQYDAAIAHVDGLLGRLVDSLTDLGVEDRTVVVVTADHGEEFHDHGQWGHGKSLYDEVANVPLVIKAPGWVGSAPVGTPAMLVDVLPTLAALLGWPATEGWEGVDLRSEATPRSLYGELIREGGFESYMIYADGHKYVESTSGLGSDVRRELYVPEQDPDERINRWRPGSSQWERKLVDERQRARERSVASEQVEIDDAWQEKLEALGYVN